MLAFFEFYLLATLVAAPILWLCVYLQYRTHPEPTRLLAAALVWPVPVVLSVAALLDLILDRFKR